MQNPVDLLSGDCNNAASHLGIMKNSIFNRRGARVLKLGFILGLSPLVSGCLQQNAIPTETAVALPRTGEVEKVETPFPEPLAVAQPTDAETGLSDAPVKVVSTEKPLPRNLRPTESLASVIKLVQSGVEESVLLTFVTNVTGTFSLGSEEIIYLSDVGVPSAVISAMLHHDHMLVQRATEVAQPAPAVEPEATTPVEFAEPEPMPVSAEPVASAPLIPDEVPTDAAFSDALSPYGTWLDVEGYGRCWQPSVVTINPGWRPYCDRGRWIYTDCGWYWASDYSWGWAPFHYGRWFQHTRLGWCWSPDNVWGPSWVSWRYSNDYCGWAPLPPVARFRPGLGFVYHGHSVGFSFNFGLRSDCYTFVPTKHFCDTRVSRHVLRRDHVTRFYKDTVAVNRIVGDHKRISNYGIPAERVAAASQARVRQVSVRGTRHHTPDNLTAGRPMPQSGGTTLERRTGSSVSPRLPIARNNSSESRNVAPTTTLADPNSATPGASVPQRLERQTQRATTFTRIPPARPSKSSDQVNTITPEAQQNVPERREVATARSRAISERNMRQYRDGSIVIHGPASNVPNPATRPSVALQPNVPVESLRERSSASFGQAQRSSNPNFSRIAEGRPRHEQPQPGYHPAPNANVPQPEQEAPIAARSQPAYQPSPFARSQPVPSAPSYNPGPMRGSVDVQRHEPAQVRNHQPAQVHSPPVRHHQEFSRVSAPPAAAPAPAPAPSRSAPAQSSSDSGRHTPSDRRGR
jgi:hypothetical protein